MSENYRDSARWMGERLKAEQDARRALVQGDTVCVVGVGMDNMVHRHNTVERVTKTLVVTNAKGGPERFGIEDGRSKPRSDYGGTELHLECRRGWPTPKNKGTE